MTCNPRLKWPKPSAIHKKLVLTVSIHQLFIGVTVLLVSSFSISATASDHLQNYYSILQKEFSPTYLKSLHAVISIHEYVPSKTIWSALENSFESAGDENQIILFYTRRSLEKRKRASGANQAKSNHWNREHIWPQSYGLKRTMARFDLHNIVPADRTVNTSRGNKYFDSGGSIHSECLECRTDSDSWEPPDVVKGDVARIMFYMDFRYDGHDESGTDDLIVSNSSSSRNEVRGLESLKLWHCSDPVSSHEIDKNTSIYSIQKNRNPFIDRPELAQYLFNFEC